MKEARQNLFRANGIRYGAAYYAEYQLSDRVDEDLDLMAGANFTVIRVGESVWSTWEPQDGVFDLDWLQPVLDGAHARGIGVVLGTPTYAVPPWLQKSHPEIAADRATGQPIQSGAQSGRTVVAAQPPPDSATDRLGRDAFITPPVVASVTSCSLLRPMRIRPPLIATVAGTAPLSRTASSAALATSTL